MNSLEDDLVIRNLYRASQEGVRCDLIVRGFCCLKPGVAGLSENISVKSIVGRFLEHSRIFYFRNGAARPADGEFFIGSADWMYRNLLARVEVITPVEERILRERCLEILELLLEDRPHSWDLRADGSYVRRQQPGGGYYGAHEKFMALTRQRSASGR